MFWREICLLLLKVNFIYNDEPEEMKILEKAGKTNFYNTVIVNRLDVKLTKKEFDYAAWIKEIEKLEIIQKPITDRDRVYYSISKLISLIKKLEIFTSSWTPPLVESTAPEESDCSISINLFTSNLQDNTLNRYKYIIKNLDSNEELFTEEVKFNKLQDSIGHINAYYQKLSSENQIYNHVIEKYNLENIIAYAGGQGLKGSCLQDFNYGEYTNFEYLDTFIKDETIISNFAVYQYRDKEAVSRYKFNAIENFELDKTKPEWVFELNKNLVIFKNIHKPFSSISHMTTLSESCTINLKDNDLKAALRSCNLQKIENNNIIIVGRNAISLNTKNINNKKFKEFKIYKNIKVKENSVELETPFGLIKVHLNLIKGTINKILHPKFSTIEVQNWEKINEIFLTGLLVFLPFTLTPIFIYAYKKRQKKKNKRKFQEEKAKSLLLLKSKIDK